MLSEDQFRENLDGVLGRIERLCHEFNRSPDEIILLPVTKKWPIEAVRFCQRAGISRVGENRVQDALAKQQEISGMLWDLIGHLQSNKVNQVMGCFERIQTVDSLKLLGKLEKGAEQKGLKCKILLQVNTGEDPAKFGLLSEQVDAVLERALDYSNLSVEGLMTIAPYAPEDPSVAQRAFVRLRELRDRLKGDFNLELKELSMGMSGDLREAIEAGSTMVRVGSALFGERIQ
jgi:pyridoxal phosphate enzyme (YggS family)